MAYSQHLGSSNFTEMYISVKTITGFKSGFKSGINTGKVVSNYTDPALGLVPSNSLLVVSPGINYGTAFDFGLSLITLFYKFANIANGAR
jgi:hypothetical protein